MEVKSGCSGPPALLFVPIYLTAMPEPVADWVVMQKAVSLHPVAVVAGILVQKLWFERLEGSSG